MSVEVIRSKAEKFQKTTFWRNVREYAAAAAVIAVFGFHYWTSDGVLFRAASALTILGSLYMVYQLHRRGSSQALPADAGSNGCLEFHRRELARQRDALASVWRWYVLPLVPGGIIFQLAVALEIPADRWGPQVITIFSLVIASIVFVLGFVVWLNHDAARKLQREIDALDELA